MSTSRGNMTFGLLPESSFKWLWVNAKLSNRLNAIELSFLTSPDPSRKWKELSSRPQGLHVLLCFQHHISTSQHCKQKLSRGMQSIQCMGVCELSVPPKDCVSLETRRYTEAKTNHTPNANLRNLKKVLNSGNWNVYKVHHGKAFVSFVSFVSLVSLLSWGICAINLDLRHYLKPELAPRKKMCDNIATRSQKGYNDFVDFATKQCVANVLLCHMN